MTRPAAVMVLCLSVLVAGCATKNPEALAQHDPWEPTNRAVFAMDVQLDHAVMEPVAKFYNSAVPAPAREGVHNALTNLDSPVVLVNDLLLGETERGGQTFSRFMINSTVGVAGFVDVAAMWGIPGHTEDFGQTLAIWGAQEGSYLVLPLLGPDPPRDLVGQGVDIAFDPLTYMSWNDSTLYMMVRYGLGVLDEQASNVDAVDQIERSSIDFYATTRSLYRQHREAEINSGKPDTSNLPSF